MSRAYGYRPDEPDSRDVPIAKLGLSAAVPSSASLHKYVVEVLEQSFTSKCVAHAWAQALRIADRVAGVSAPQLTSRDFLYYNSLGFDGEGFIDQGTRLRSCAKGLIKFGRPPESVWPFKTDSLVERPPWNAYRQAFDHKGPSGYHRVSTLAEIKQAIAAGHAVVGGVDIGPSFENFGGSGIYSKPAGEAPNGGHALTLIGYDERSFELVNSWGTFWADRGFTRVAPSFVSDFSDLWVVSL